MRTALAILIASLAGAAAAAPTRPAASAPSVPPKTVSPLTVVPGDRAKLVSSYPAAGQVVAPGVLVLKLTFDQKMLDSSFDIEAAPGSVMPKCLKTPRLLNDRKTFVLLCTTAPKTSYEVAFNAAKDGGFENTGEIRAERSTLSFSTNDAAGPVDLASAMKLEGLGDVDVPIEKAPDTGSESP